jgi:hypothetical protein
LNEFLDRLESTVTGLPEPVAEVSIGKERTPVMPKELERLFKQIGADDS